MTLLDEEIILINQNVTYELNILWKQINKAFVRIAPAILHTFYKKAFLYQIIMSHISDARREF
jgi:hypothetical protein